jgi:DNA-binding transcriptional regulator YiaG
VKRNPATDPLPIARVQEVVRHVSAALPKLDAATTSDEVMSAIAELLGGMTDVLSIPLFAEVAGRAMIVGARDALAEMRETGKIGAIQLSNMRKGIGISQRELAARIGQPQSVIARWETGVLSIPKKHVPAILDALTAPRT